MTLEMKDGLGILIVAATPDRISGTRGPDESDAAREIRDIQDVLAAAPGKASIRYHSLPAVTWQRMHDALLRFRPDIVHVIARGDAGLMEFESEERLVHRVSAADLASLLAKFSDSVRLVVYSACDSSVLAAATKDAIGCAVGFDGFALPADTCSFAAAFYRNLVEGVPCPLAFERAKAVTPRARPVLVTADEVREDAARDSGPRLADSVGDACGEHTAHDAVLCYDRQDRQAVEALARDLMERGIRPWFDKWHLRANRSWSTEVRESLARTHQVIVCVGQGGPARRCEPELPEPMSQAIRDPKCPVIVVMLDEEPLSLPSHLGNRARVDLHGDREAGLRAIGAWLGVSKRVPSDVGCPYRGLQTFGLHDAQWMFGREGDIARLLERLRTGERLLFLVGASGSGKSSLVLAGLVPEVRCGGLDGSDDWHVLVMRPGARPCTELATALLDLEGSGAHDVRNIGALQDLRTRLLESEMTLADVAELLLERQPGMPGASPRLLLVVDQFEEVFTLGAAKDEEGHAVLSPEAQAFVHSLLAATSAPSGRIVVIATVRADFVETCLDTPYLNARFTTSVIFALAQMGEGELREAISRPARLAGAAIEGAVIDSLIHGMREQPGRLPLLQHALTELWERRDFSHCVMTYESYQALGGIEGSIAEKAGLVLASMSPEEQQVARRVFRRMVHLGEGTGDSRRRASRLEFASDATACAVLDRLIAARLLTANQDTIEISHEVLIHAWATLRRWVSENREALRLQHEVTRSASAWRDSGYKETELWRGGQLQRVLQLRDAGELELSAQESLFLDAGYRARVRAARLRYALAGLAFLTVSALAVWALRERAVAQQYAQRRLAAAARLAIRDAMEHDPTTAAVLLREPGIPELLDDWWSLALFTIREPIARVVLKGPSNGMVQVSFSPDGKLIASTSIDQKVRIWNADGSGQPRVLSGHEGEITSVAFSPDGDKVVTASADRTARVWSIDGSRPPVVLRGHNEGLMSASFSPDDARVVTASFDETARVWSAQDGTLLHLLLGRHKDDVRSALYTPDGRRIITASQDDTIWLWSEDGSRQSRIPCSRQDNLLAPQGVIQNIALSPDGLRIAAGRSDGSVTICRVAGQAQPVSLDGHSATIVALQFSHDGKRLITGSLDQTVRVWDAMLGVELMTIRHPAEVSGVAFRHDGAEVLTATFDSVLRIFDTRSIADRVILHGHTGGVSSAAFTSDGTRVVTASRDGTVRIWPLDRGHEPRIINLGESATFAAPSPDGKRIAVACYDGTLRIYDAHGNGNPMIIEAAARELRFVSFSPDGTRVSSTAYDGTVRVWDAESGKLLDDLAGHSDIVYSSVFSADGKRIVTASLDKTARVWAVDGTGYAAVMPYMVAEAGLTYAMFSPDGTRVIVSGRDGNLRIWNIDGTEPPRLLQAHAGVVATFAAFSPDGRHIVSSSWDKTARIWELDGTETPLTLLGHSDGVASAAFHPDGDRVVTASWDSTVRLWRIYEPRELLERLWQATSYCLSPADRRRYMGEDEPTAERNALCCRQQAAVAEAGHAHWDITCGSDN